MEEYRCFGDCTVKRILADVPVKPGGKYYATLEIKLKNQKDDYIYHSMYMAAMVASSKTKAPPSPIPVCRLPYVSLDDDWVTLAGDIHIPQGCDTLSMASTCDEGVDFDFRNPDLNELVPNEKWEEEANERIERLRKGDINLSIDISDKYDPSKIVIQVEQKSHSFPFGSAVQARRLVSSDREDAAYREFFFENFRWATIENAFKWRFMEPVQSKPIYELVDGAVEVLKSKGINLRAHCVTWAKSTKIIPWLSKLKRSEVEEAVNRRIEQLTRRYCGIFSQWDVCNEALHGDWYNQKSKDKNFIDGMFKKMIEMDPSAILCTNDYDVCSKGVYTTAYARQGKNMKERGLCLNFMGIQSHMSVYPDPDLLMKRLEVLSEAEIPLFITELDVRQEDMDRRAQGYEDILRLYFSHPNVHGIILWGFWDKAISQQEAATAEGSTEIKWNKAGERIHKLWKKEWWTTREIQMSKNKDTLKVRGFYGDYHMTLLYKGEEQWSHDFTLEKNKAVNIDVKI